MAISSGCTDDLHYNTTTVPDGLPATVSMKLAINGQAVYTRATDNDSKVNTLWVGIYNKSTGQRSFSRFYDAKNDDFLGENDSKFVTLENIECLSGESYIVAVANYDAINAIDVNDKDNITALKGLLDAAESWDDYLNISVVRSVLSGNDISIATQEYFLMAGSFFESHKSEKEITGMETVAIPGGVSDLNGAIHLRRLLTKNTFNISVGAPQQDGKAIIDFELLDMEIMNLPRYSWVHSRNGGQEGSPANAGDRVASDGGGVNNPAYMSSMTYTPTASEVEYKDGTYTMSFWQVENKRTGSNANSYEDREREIKADGLNTGIYQSLASSADDLNNNATYVKIRANVTYTSPKDNINNPTEEDGFIDNDKILAEEGNVVTREAEVTYVVHLGYIDDANDFNCYRNSDYTYYITAVSVNKIIVEAFTDKENQPGAEGFVTDITDQLFEVDAHFGVFNIYLSKEELQSFSFSMRTYEDGVGYEIKYSNENGTIVEQNIPKDENDASFKYYDWIEIVPTGNTDKNRNQTVLAQYPGYNRKYSSSDTKGKLYLKDLVEHKDELDGQWFTVYVNEYTYEHRDPSKSGWGNETSGQNWKKYVNQPNRQVWFNVALKQSADKESTYFKAKYALTQKSIQTYYDVAPSTCFTAIGLEHTNESFGMNLRWMNTDNGNLDPDNGRYNVGRYVGVTESNQGNAWTTVISPTAQQVVNALSNTKQTDPAGLSMDSRSYYVPSLVTIATSSLSGTAGMYNGPAAKDYDPQSGNNVQYIDGLKACLNRNRDENGNGKIDPSELKWYLPASGKYLRAIIGRNSLPSPLMVYSQYQLAGFCGDDTNTLYHYLSSDGKIIWVDEGMSSSVFYQPGNWSHAPWQIRCIRNLGTDLTSVSTGEKVEAAYLSDMNTTTKGGIVTVEHYYGSTLREPSTTTLPMHRTSDPQNRISRYGFEIAPRGNAFLTNNNYPASEKSTGYKESMSYSKYVEECITDNKFCESLNTTTGRKGWRIPTQKEIVIMMRLKYKNGNNDVYYLVPNGETNCVVSTQEHWDNTGAATPLSSDSWTHRLTTVDLNAKIGTAINIDEHAINAVRCVRDLTEAEKGMSYEKVLQFKNN